MKGIYWQKGDTLDYTPKEAVEYGQVVDLTTRIGVAAVSYTHLTLPTTSRV